jgi:hypothetical protein
MKSSLAFVAVLLLANCAQAQQQHHMIPMATSQSYINNGFGGGGFGGGGFGSIGGSSGRPVRYEEPRNFAIGYLTNDGDTAVATYMNYDEALALGKKLLAEAELAARTGAAPSLGEVARMYRAAKVPTLQLQARVTQDNFGKLQVCNLNGNDCHRP